MMQVVNEELGAMDAESLRCAAELADARVDVMCYTSRVEIKAIGPGYHRTSESKLAAAAAAEGGAAAVVTTPNCTLHQMLLALGLDPLMPDHGSALSA